MALIRSRRLPIAALAVAALAALFWLGPRNTQDAAQAALAWPQPPAEIAALPEHLAQLEQRHPGITPGAEKRVVLAAAAGGSGQAAVRTPWSVVYLHGFTATRQETAPLAEDVAAALGAHLFATRFTGHGRGGAAMTEASVAAWKADALEALAIGRVLGERVLVIGVSTGATLAVWLAQQPAAAQDTAWVLVSPNFAPADAAAKVINWPWGRTLARWTVGAEHGFAPRSAEHARYWTTRYPVQALFPMMAAVHLAQQQPLQRWQTPVLMMLSPRDQVIDVGAARAAFERIASPHKRLVEVLDAGDPGQHVIAGRIKSPQSTPGMVRTIAGWAQALPAR